MISEERFWDDLLGQRLSHLGKKYFGNEIVLLSAIFYVTSFFQSNGLKALTGWWDILLGNRNVTVEIREIEDMYDAVDAFVRRNTECNPELLEASAAYEPGQREVVGFYPLLDTICEIKYKGYTLFVSRNEEESKKGTSDGRTWQMEYITVSMKGKTLKLLKQFIQEWCDEHNKRIDYDEFDLYTYRQSRWTYIKSLGQRNFDAVTLQEGVKEGLVQDMEAFKKHKEWYAVRGVPYRRGYLLHGPPGTGKTTLIQVLASKLMMNVAIVSLLEVKSDSEFSEMVCQVPRNSLLVIEDIDHYLSSSSSDGKRDVGVTMSGMLNALDGIQAQEGAMVFMTGNNIEKLNPALLRPGRIDVKVLLGYADHKQTKEMFWRFFGTDFQAMKPAADDRKAALEDYCNKFTESIPEGQVTTAEIQNYFITLLMNYGLYNPTNEVLDKVVSGVNEFLAKVKFDRDQALMHKKKETNEGLSQSKSASSADQQTLSNDSSDDTSSDSSDVTRID
ncbi:hypothetical protein DFQ30_005703 [Apophysomyces sp. BC1015]|nr:hypothetical protein DFQ30_005703 [Apophysomyces sp. BC1015]KAG0177581.1 hypothetical protein DFQ29_004660 [Apophysomyces sp. BC1021]